MLKYLIGKHEIKCGIRHGDVAIRFNVEPGAIRSIPQSQVVHYIVPCSVRVAGVEEIIDVTSRPAPIVENADLLGHRNAFGFTEGNEANIAYWHRSPPLLPPEIIVQVSQLP